MKHEVKVYLSKAIEGKSSSFLYFLKVNGKTREEAVKRIMGKNLSEWAKQL